MINTLIKPTTTCRQGWSAVDLLASEEMCHCSVFGCLFARCSMERVAVTQWEFLLERLIMVSRGLGLHHCEQMRLSSGQTNSYAAASHENQRLCLNECLSGCF